MRQLHDRVMMSGLNLVPQTVMSRLVGNLAHLKLPGPFGRYLVHIFAKRHGINLNEAEGAISDYHTVGALFARRLKVGSRTIDRRPKHLVSPTDGRILSSGRINKDGLIQGDNLRFTVTELLGSAVDAEKFEGGSWLALSLGRSDYHGVHHPVEGTIVKARYLPGHLFLSKRAGRIYDDRLFCVNERLATFVKSPVGIVATVMVGVASMGHLTVTFDEALKMKKNNRGGEYHYPYASQIARGDELGIFHLGSTAIVLIESPDVSLDAFDDGQAVRMGQSIARVSGGK